MDRWEEIENIYFAARGLRAEERSRFLDERCGLDNSVRRRVDVLLEQDANSNSFLNRPAVEYAGTWPPSLTRGTTLTRRSIGRYDVLAPIGAGGMGVVYEAFDREREVRIAIKTLRDFTAGRLLLFKNEFRALADVAHPNLVSLGDLFEHEGTWFFTMELVPGTDFLTYVRSGQDSAAGVESTSAAAAETIPLDAAATQTPDAAERLRGADVTRLRDVLRQLCLGLSALHAAGKVHRDVKPSNVRVTPNGQVKILDFGLVTDVVDAGAIGDAHFAGTPRYMAPEQAASHPVRPAADWYAVGVMLYEALTGRAPFLGPAMDVLRDKQCREPIAPRALVPALPDDLDRLCRDLLRLDPRARPNDIQVLARLGVREELPVRDLAASRAPLFVGRAHELSALGEAFEGCGTTTRVFVVEGESGIGKSALVRRFCADLSNEDGVMVLAARCYEREAVPFKAVDGMIDSLSSYLAKLPETEAAASMPRHAGLLARVFPVLQRVSPFATAPAAAAGLDTQEQRTRLFGAVREMLMRLSDRHRVVLAIDDLQWADADSLTLLDAVLRPPEAPPLLLIATRRPGGPRLRWPCESSCLELGTLPLSEARELAQHLSGQAADWMEADLIAEEAKGHPLFVDELVRHRLEAGAVEATAPAVRTNLDEAITTRVARLRAAQREVVRIVAVAGAPVAIDVAAQAAGQSLHEFEQNVAFLRVAHLVRASSGEARDLVECYHDRVREAIVCGLDDRRTSDCHRRLALALETRDGDPEPLANHWLGAGDRTKAAFYAERAAANAAEQVAFDRAAELYRLAITLGHPEAVSLRPRLAAALANAGRGQESAQAYLDAAEHAQPADALEYRRRAAERLLTSGHVESGLEVIRAVLGAIGMKLPATPRSSLLTLVLERVRLRRRGYHYVPRPENEVAKHELLRIDTCYSIALSLGMVDTVRGAAFQTRGLRLALRAGEPRRAVRALALEAIFHSVERPGSPRAIALYQTAAGEAERLDNPHLLAWVLSAAGIDAYERGAFLAALDHCDQAGARFRTQPGATLELDTAQAFALWALYYLGRWAEMGRRIPRLLAEAHRQNNLYAVTNLTTGLLATTSLAADQVEAARESVARAEALWARQSGWCHLQHYLMWLATSHIELYARQPSHDRAVRFWPGLERSFLLRLAIVHTEALHLRARTALAEARHTTARAPALVRSARTDARRFARDKYQYARPMADLIFAGADAIDGDSDGALAHLERAIVGFDAAGMTLFSAVARRRKGEILGGSEGRALASRADDFMRGEHIISPGCIVDLLAPGFLA
jgi:hypothetical protein